MTKKGRFVFSFEKQALLVALRCDAYLVFTCLRCELEEVTCRCSRVFTYFVLSFFNIPFISMQACWMLLIMIDTHHWYSIEPVKKADEFQIDKRTFAIARAAYGLVQKCCLLRLRIFVQEQYHILLSEKQFHHGCAIISTWNTSAGKYYSSQLDWFQCEFVWKTCKRHWKHLCHLGSSYWQDWKSWLAKRTM